MPSAAGRGTAGLSTAGNAGGRTRCGDEASERVPRAHGAPMPYYVCDSLSHFMLINFFSLIGNTCRMGKLSNRGEKSGNQSKVYFSLYQSAIGAEERGGDPHREAPPLPAQSLGFDFIHLSASS